MPEIVETISEPVAEIAHAAQAVIDEAEAEAARIRDAVVATLPSPVAAPVVETEDAVGALRDELMGAIGELRALVEKSTEAATEAVEEVSEVVEDVPEAIEEAVSGAADLAGEGVEGAAGAVEDVAEGVGDVAEGGIEAIEEAPRRAHFLFRPISDFFGGKR